MKEFINFIIDFIKTQPHGEDGYFIASKYDIIAQEEDFLFAPYHYIPESDSYLLWIFNMNYMDSPYDDCGIFIQANGLFVKDFPLIIIGNSVSTIEVNVDKITSYEKFKMHLRRHLEIAITDGYSEEDGNFITDFMEFLFRKFEDNQKITKGES